jgi:hypothetical protein
MSFRHRLVKSIALFISFFGAVVIIGWIFDIPALKSILPQWVTMKFSTAICFVSSGVILFFMVKAKEGRFTLAQTFIALATLVITMLMSSLLVFIIFNVKTGIEDLFLKESALAAFTPVPGQPSIGTMVNFFIISICGLLSMNNFQRNDNIITLFAGIIFIVGLTAITGYILNKPALYYAAKNISAGMALHTAILFVLYSFGLYLLFTKNLSGEKI